jgi:hypothetical protein|tara:strand:- start:80 stop:238 length:159 start_codon:yes stop_codon:yes gene_type:complete
MLAKPLPSHIHGKRAFFLTKFGFPVMPGQYRQTDYWQLQCASIQFSVMSANK